MERKRMESMSMRVNLSGRLRALFERRNARAVARMRDFYARHEGDSLVAVNGKATKKYSPAPPERNMDYLV